MHLSKAEEQLMEIIWQQEKVFMKDIINTYPEPKPATTTIATLLKRMQDKGFVSYTVFGNSREYHALVKKADYFSKHVKAIIKNYFDNSPMQFASFFTTATDLTSNELEDLKKIVEQEIKRKEKMTAYLIKVILSSAVFLLVYRLLFEKEKMFRFNRFYLLSTLLLSFLIPFLSLPGQPSIIAGMKDTVISAEGFYIAGHNRASSAGDAIEALPDYKLVCYFLTTAVLFLRFIFNLNSLLVKISHNSCILHGNVKIVLIEDNLMPFSFLNYIFVNKQQYKRGCIESEILSHEQAHIDQRHTLDVLFIELVQVIVWFNPVFYLYRKAIELNHEFLADESVIRTYHNTAAYQYLLINKVCQRRGSDLASQFNYSITKKRFIMMTKTTSRTTALCKQLAILPMLFLAVAMFGATTIAQQSRGKAKPEQAKGKHKQQGVPKEELLKYEEFVNGRKDEKGKIMFSRFTREDETKLERTYLAMSKEQQAKQIVRFEPAACSLPRAYPSAEQIEKWKTSPSYGVWIDGKKVSKAVLANYSYKEFSSYFVSKLYGLALRNVTHTVQVDLMTRAHYDASRKKAIAEKREYYMYALMPVPKPA